MNGRIVRLIRFQSWFKVKGMTGWTFAVYLMASAGPIPKSQLFWIGTLIRLATGFSVFLTKSASWAFSSAAVVSAFESVWALMLKVATVAINATIRVMDIFI